MSPVNRAGLDSEISPRHLYCFLCINFDEFIREAGLAQLPRSRFFDRDLGNRDENISM